MAPRGYDRYMIVVGAGRNRKFVRLTDSERCAHFLGVLSIAAQSPRRGYLLISDGEEAGAEEVANEAAVPLRAARGAMDKLKRLGVLIRDEEVSAWRVRDWDEINPPPGTSTERVRRYRANQRNASATGNGTPSVSEALQSALPEVEEEVETETSSSDADGADVKITKDDRKLCGLLRELATERNPKFKVKSSSRWLTDMRRLRELDGNSVAEIEDALRWVFRDDFWGGVIQSPGNLREHFGQIWDKMGRSNVRHLPSSSAVPEHLRSTPEHQAQIEAHLRAQREGA